MGYCHQEWGDTREPQGIWPWAVVGSLLVHGLLVAGMLLVLKEKPPPRRVVVPVEAIALVPMQPMPKGGGGGHPAPVAKTQPVASKPAAPLSPKPRGKPPPLPKVKPAPPPPPEPTTAPVINRPAAPPAVIAAKPSAVATSPSGAGAPDAGGSGAGQGGRGGGQGAGTGGGGGPGQGRGSGPGSALQGYLRQIRQLLERHKDYPGTARRRNIQGVVMVRFTILAGGQVEVTRISRSSGHDLLDEAALNTVRRAGKFPPIPTDLNRQNLTVEVPLAFRLRQD